MVNARRIAEDDGPARKPRRPTSVRAESRTPAPARRAATAQPDARCINSKRFSGQREAGPKGVTAKWFDIWRIFSDFPISWLLFSEPGPYSLWDGAGSLGVSGLGFGDCAANRAGKRGSHGF